MNQPPAGFFNTLREDDWTSGVQVDRLNDLDRLEVHTQNSLYEITVINPKSGEVLLRGGRHFPHATLVHLLGASIDDSSLKVRGIYPGFRMEFLHGSRRVATSSVRS